jgi:uncharacterized phiE125 gp8 family phage protein
MGYLISKTITSAPSVEPVTAAEVKLFSKIDFSDDDTLLTIQIKSAREMVEQYLNKALITQTITAYWRNYDNRVYLPYGPHQSVTSVTRKRRAESALLVEDTDYYVMGYDTYSLDLEPSGVMNPRGTSKNEAMSAWDLEVVYVAGYGAASTDIPQPIKEAILKTVETNYDHRGNISANPVSTLSNEAKALLHGYRTPAI